MIYIVETKSITESIALLSAETMGHAKVAIKLLKEEMPEVNWSIMTSDRILNVPAFEKYLRKTK